MGTMSRREFLNTAVSLGGAATMARIIPNVWVAPVHAATPGFFESEFGINDAMCKKVLEKALSKGGAFADLYFEYTVSNVMILEDGKVNQAKGSVNLGVGIRTVKGDQTGYGYTQELT